MNLTEKLSLLEEVWDSIAQEHSEIPMPEWQKRELDKRYEEYKSGK
ncbi:MAG: addiction module protein [bacterium]